MLSLLKPHIQPHPLFRHQILIDGAFNGLPPVPYHPPYHSPYRTLARAQPAPKALTLRTKHHTAARGPTSREHPRDAKRRARADRLRAGVQPASLLSSSLNQTMPAMVPCHSMCVCVHMCTCVHVCVCMCGVHVCMCACVHECVCVCVCTDPPSRRLDTPRGRRVQF